MLMKYCPKCGKSVADDVKFCPSCGEALATAASAPSQQPSHAKKKTTGKLLFTATRSIWYYKWRCAAGILISLIGLLLCICVCAVGSMIGLVFLLGPVIGALMLIFSALAAHAYRIQIYDDHIIVREGLINVKERRSVLTPIVGVSVSQSLWGKLCNYGNVHIDKQGKGWDISSEYISHPAEFKSFLEKMMSSTDYSSINYVMNN